MDVGKLPFASPDNSFLQIPSMTVSSGMSGRSISEKGKMKRDDQKSHFEQGKECCLSPCSLITISFQTLIHLSIDIFLWNLLNVCLHGFLHPF